MNTPLNLALLYDCMLAATTWLKPYRDSAH